MKTLWKKDSKGKIRILNISYTEIGELIQESGLEDGKLVPHKKLCNSKNVGRSNETTPKQQAISEMKSLITEKLSENYYSLEMLEELARKQKLIK